MISWLDIASPSLRLAHEAWIEIRGVKLLPPAAAYADFAADQPSQSSPCIAIPKSDSAPAYLFVGSRLDVLLKHCRIGTRLEQIAPLGLRVAVTTPVAQVISTRQPISGSHPLATASQPKTYQWLLLPFGTENQVRLIHTTYDIA